MNNKKRYWLIEAMDCNLIDQIRKIKIRNQRILIKYADYYSWKIIERQKEQYAKEL